jgi:hypothetical protein
MAGYIYTRGNTYNRTTVLDLWMTGSLRGLERQGQLRKEALSDKQDMD